MKVLQAQRQCLEQSLLGYKNPERPTVFLHCVQSVGSLSKVGEATTRALVRHALGPPPSGGRAGASSGKAESEG